MTLDELAAAVQRVADLERRVRELEARNEHPAGPMFVTLERAEELFGVSVSRLRKWIKDGALPASKEKRVWLVATADVEQRVRSLRAPVRPSRPAREEIEDAANSIVARLPRRASR